jgi:hypothetical protein
MHDAHGTEQPVSVPAMRAQVDERKLMELFRGGLRAELFVPFLPLQEEILRRAVRLPFENRPIWVTTAEDMVLLKMVFHREKDLLDVRGILWVQRGRLDVDYLRTWSDRMLDDNVRQELEDMLREYRDDRGGPQTR